MKSTVPFSSKPMAIEVDGVPCSVSESQAAVFTSRLDRAARELIADGQLTHLEVTVRFGPAQAQLRRARDAGDNGDSPSESRAQYVARDPLFNKDLLVLPTAVLERLHAAVDTLALHRTIFEEWGLTEIEPRPKTALSFHGQAGTGKTLAAHTVASLLGKRILAVSSADVEGIYHGESAKNVAMLFRSAQEQDAVLFLDEADSLLSKRLATVSQGADIAINSLRSQLLASLDAYRGYVIFATNLVSNYDPAFDTRVEHIHFPAPDRTARVELWRRHLPPRLPLEDVSVEELADQSEGLVGREIKTAVIAASVAAARKRQGFVTQADLLNSVARGIEARVDR